MTETGRGQSTEYWTPDPATVLRLYTQLEKGPGWLELDWKCPGRRAPTPEGEEAAEEEEEVRQFPHLQCAPYTNVQYCWQGGPGGGEG